MENHSNINQITWRGITIEVTYFPNKWNSIAHIEVRSIHPERAPIPITETGYKSHFLPIGILEENQITAAEMILQWIEKEAESTAWKNLEQSTKQLSLF